MFSVSIREDRRKMGKRGIWRFGGKLFKLDFFGYIYICCDSAVASVVSCVLVVGSMDVLAVI